MPIAATPAFLVAEPIAARTGKLTGGLLWGGAGPSTGGAAASGSLAKFAARQRASSFVSRLWA